MNGCRQFDGMNLHTCGEGPGVLWIHGYTMDSSIWRPLWNLLPGWRHIGVDLPCHGDSRSFRNKEGLRELARSLTNLAAETSAVHLVGMSFGSMVALQIALEEPELFATVTLGSPALAGGPVDAHAAVQNRKLIRLYQERGPGPWMRDSWMNWPPDIFKGAARHPALFESLRETIARHRWEEMRGVVMDRFANFPQSEAAIARVQSRLLLLVGDDDMPAFKRAAELIRRGAPRSERVYLPQCGHLSLIECPNESAACIASLWAGAAGQSHTIQLPTGELNGTAA